MSGLTNDPVAKHVTTEDIQNPEPKRDSRLGLAAVAFSAIGCLGWGLIVPFLDACQQGEQLARFFAALFNVIILSGAGGLATIFLILGLMLSFSATHQGQQRPAVISLVLSNLGFAIAAAILVLYLPRALSILH